MTEVILVPLTPDDREQFINDNQKAFNYGALEEFGFRDEHFEDDGEIISRETIERSIDGGEAYRIMQDGKPVGGVVIKVDGECGDLDLLRFLALMFVHFIASKSVDISSVLSD